MKKIVFSVLVAMSFLMTGCFDDEDGYSLSNMWVGFGVLQETDNESVRIIMDNDDVLIPVASNHNHPWNMDRHDDYEKPIENGDRLLVNYTILSDEVNTDGDVISYFVKLNSSKKVLMKDIVDITAEIEDSIGNDPLIVQDYWINDSLLTFKIKYWGNHETHFINLVKQPGELSASNQPIELELRHNDKNDEEYIPYAAYVSFKLHELEIAGQNSVQFVVTATDYNDEEFTFEGTYTYGE